MKYCIYIAEKICTILNHVSEKATVLLLTIYTVLPESAPKCVKTMIVYCILRTYVIQICVILLAIMCFFTYLFTPRCTTECRIFIGPYCLKYRLFLSMFLCSQMDHFTVQPAVMPVPG